MTPCVATPTSRVSSAPFVVDVLGSFPVPERESQWRERVAVWTASGQSEDAIDQRGGRLNG